MIEPAIILDWTARAAKARKEAHKILSVHERSTSSRVVILEDLLAKLSKLPVDVQDYFDEATVCLENGLLRAAIVLSWAGFFHVLSENLYTNHLVALKAVRPKWVFNTIEELKEHYTESAILDAAKEAGLIGKASLREYQGQLSKRNQCAHPTLYRPSVNSSLGYVDDMIRQTIKYL
jgi:hypothetical protein